MRGRRIWLGLRRKGGILRGGTSLIGTPVSQGWILDRAGSGILLPRAPAGSLITEAPEAATPVPCNKKNLGRENNTRIHDSKLFVCLFIIINIFIKTPQRKFVT